jgi:two-component system sensor histidine kinase/response regulator
MRGLIEIEGTTPRTLKQLHSLMATQLTASPVIGSFVVFDAAGNWIVNSGSTPSYNVADRAYFQYHRSHTDRGAHIADPVRSKVSNRWVVPVTRRIDAPDGSFAGIMLASVSAEMFVKFYESFDVGRQGVISLVTADGIIVTRNRLGTDGTGRSVANSNFFQQTLSRPALPTLDYVSHGMEFTVSAASGRWKASCSPS